MYGKHIKNSFYCYWYRAKTKRDIHTWIVIFNSPWVVFSPITSVQSFWLSRQPLPSCPRSSCSMRLSFHIPRGSVLLWTSLAPGPSPSSNKIAGLALGRGPGLASWLFTGKRWNAGAGILDFNNCQLSVIKVNKKNTDRAIDRLLETLGLAITLKEWQRQAVNGNDVFVTMPTGYGKS